MNKYPLPKVGLTLKYTNYETPPQYVATRSRAKKPTNSKSTASQSTSRTTRRARGKKAGT